jgi:co-chaperonin GroES (HSP10)
MKGMHDYIVEVKEAYNESFKTESGVEIFADKRFSADRLANRLAKVINVPALQNSIIKEGYEVMVDPTIFLKQKYEKHAENDNVFLQDAKKGWYKIQPSMIVLYRENSESEWKAFGQNLLVEFIKEIVDEKKIGSIVTQLQKSKYVEGVAKLVFLNEEMEEDGAKINDTIAIKKGFGVSFWIDGKEFFWIRNRDVLVIINQN